MNYENIKERLLEINRSLRLDNGFYIASLGKNYSDYCWLRDIFYQSLPNLKNDYEKFIQTYRTFLDFLHKYEWKMDNLINDPNSYDGRTALHPRVYPDLEEIHTPWGNKQMDAICLMLFGLGLGLDARLSIIRNEGDRRVVQKCIDMYESLEYWHLAGSDAWEENEEIHSHALGAALAAFEKLITYGWKVDPEKLHWCECELAHLLPRESITKEYDLAQLQLIWPLNVVTPKQEDQILHNIETKLLRDRGVIRYEGDTYFNIASKESHEMFSSLYHPKWEGWPKLNEMQWTFGLAYLAMIYMKRGEDKAAELCINQIINDSEDLEIPEGYYALTKIANENKPLGWAVALTIVAIDEYEYRHKE